MSESEQEFLGNKPAMEPLEDVPPNKQPDIYDYRETLGGIANYIAIIKAIGVEEIYLAKIRGHLDETIELAATRYKPILDKRKENNGIDWPR